MFPVLIWLNLNTSCSSWVHSIATLTMTACALGSWVGNTVTNKQYVSQGKAVSLQHACTAWDNFSERQIPFFRPLPPVGGTNNTSKMKKKWGNPVKSLGGEAGSGLPASARAWVLLVGGKAYKACNGWSWPEQIQEAWTAVVPWRNPLKQCPGQPDAVGRAWLRAAPLISAQAVLRSTSFSAGFKVRAWTAQGAWPILLITATYYSGYKECEVVSEAVSPLQLTSGTYKWNEFI